jgi:hypothetical protein
MAGEMLGAMCVIIMCADFTAENGGFLMTKEILRAMTTIAILAVYFHFIVEYIVEEENESKKLDCLCLFSLGVSLLVLAQAVVPAPIFNFPNRGQVLMFPVYAISILCIVIISVKRLRKCPQKEG